MGQKKPFVLRLSSEMMEALQRMSADEFRSVNGQIEAILAETLRKRGYLKRAKPRAESEENPL